MFTRKGIACKYVAALLCLTVSVGFAKAETAHTGETYAEGVATIEHGDRDAARQRALEDALIQASLSLGAHVLSTEQLNASNVQLQSLQIRPTQWIARYSILREWEDQAMYHVAVSAEGKGEASVTNIHAVKKKVAFTQFDVVNTIQVDDIRNIYDGLPIELSRRLEAGGGFLSNYVSGNIPRDVDALQQKAVIRIANESGAQFMVSGRVLDAGIDRKDGFWGTSLGRKTRRHFQIEFAVHDGLTGVQLYSHRLEDDAQGEVMIGNDKPFGSSIFYQTESGRALNRLISAVTIKISEAMACLPFSARVVRVESQSVYLDAGETSMLKVGDKLALYSDDFNTPVVGVTSAMLGIPERPVTTVTLIKIQPRFSIAELPEDAFKLGIKTGGIARFEFDGKGRGSSNCLQ